MLMGEIIQINLAEVTSEERSLSPTNISHGSVSTGTYLFLVRTEEDYIFSDLLFTIECGQR